MRYPTDFIGRYLTGPPEPGKCAALQRRVHRPAIQKDVLAHNEPRMLAAQECTHSPELCRCAIAPRGNARAALGPRRLCRNTARGDHTGVNIRDFAAKTYITRFGEPVEKLVPEQHPDPISQEK